jgi:AraC-like DNA-binding protein
MSFRKYPPCAALAPWISGFQTIDTPDSADGSDQAAHTVLPDVEPVMGFQYRGRAIAVRDDGQVLLERAGITGIQTQARAYRYHPGSGTVLVRFHPWGASAFLPAPMREISDRSIGLDALLSRSAIREVEDRLQGTRTDPERIQVIESFLLSRLRERTPDGVVRRAVRLLLSHGQGVSVERLAETLGIGERQLERKFGEWVGVAPKRFARLARFRNVIAGWNASPGTADAIGDGGFFDQSHFIKDFRAFAGTTPEAYLRGLRAFHP